MHVTRDRTYVSLHEAPKSLQTKTLHKPIHAMSILFLIKAGLCSSLRPAKAIEEAKSTDDEIFAC